MMEVLNTMFSRTNYSKFKSFGLGLSFLSALFVSHVGATPKFEKEIKITDSGLYFDGKKVGKKANNNHSDVYDFHFGRRITPHGDSIKKYQQYVFMTWYRGGKDDRHVMLTRYNTKTGTLATIEFPHQHSGFRNQWWIGESHNTIAVGISPIDDTVHLLYDMHAYSKDRPADGSLARDYFRYTYSYPGLASAADKDFTLDKFVKDKTDNDYKHLTLTGKEDAEAFSGLTYPKFFLNTDGTLLMYMRKGGNNNGGYKFANYKADQKRWSEFTEFNVMNAKSHGNKYNWGLYGSMKYVNGKLRVGFQQRANIQDDKYVYQNGFYYAYSNAPDGGSQWQDHRGQNVAIPLINSDLIKVSEPGDLIPEKGKNQVYMVGGFDWTVTKRGDIHIIGKVRNMSNTQNKNVHTYKPAGAKSFITSTEFSGADSIYTAGDNIYIIGLNRSGRPYIERAKGGTNNFERIYDASTGRKFRHGNVYIDDGKLYYYLMEKGSGTAQPIYLQVIDLNIE